jgi:hypothetical protein
VAIVYTLSFWAARRPESVEPGVPRGYPFCGQKRVPTATYGDGHAFRLAACHIPRRLVLGLGGVAFEERVDLGVVDAGAAAHQRVPEPVQCRLLCGVWADQGHSRLVVRGSTMQAVADCMRHRAASSSFAEP